MSATAEIFFDESLPALVEEVARLFGSSALEDGVIVRDTSGRLRFISSAPSPSDEERAKFEVKLSNVLGAYAREDRVIAFGDEPGSQLLLNDAAVFSMQQESVQFRFLDRRIVGSAWLGRPK